MQSLDVYLRPTRIIDSDHPLVVKTASQVAENTSDKREIAVKLYYWVRDQIRYDPYAPFYKEEHYRASWIIRRGASFCVGKASLMCALCRSMGIPARPAFADVKNHLATRRFLERLGTDLVTYHGYVEMYLGDRWVKASPTFDVATCNRFGVPPLDFNGIDDALLQAYAPDAEGMDEPGEVRRFMEYVRYHGHREDIPVEEILSAWEKVYGRDRVKRWIEELERD